MILRHFGRPGLIAAAAPLGRIVQARGGVFLIAADPGLASETGADGVHWPERRLGEARLWRMKRPGWIVTASAHSRPALRRAAELADAALLSPVFPSRSASADRPLGPLRAGMIARGARTPVYALGGVKPGNVKRLEGFEFSGIAAVESLLG